MQWNSCDTVLDCKEGRVAYLTFVVDGRTYAIQASHILEIAEITSITALPRTAPYVLGVTTIRNTICSVLDFRRMDSAGNPPPSCHSVAILLTYNDSNVCIVVDRVISVVDIDNAKSDVV